MQVTIRITTAFSAILTIGSFVITSASADSEKRMCPGLEESAGAEEQVVCWFDRSRQNEDTCIDRVRSTDECVRQATIWCNEATLDNALVSNACFLSYIQEEKFEQAQKIAEYLQSPTGNAAECLNALKFISVPVVSKPVGAEIIVNGSSYGPAPVQVRLTGQWWQNSITAKFEKEPDIEYKKAFSDDLLAAFDHRTCVMSNVVIEGPEPEQGPTTIEEPVVRGDSGDHSPQPFSEEGNADLYNAWGHGTFWTGLGIAGFGAIAMLQGISYGKDFDKDESEAHSNASKSKTWTGIMWTSYGVGAALMITGITLWSLPAREESRSSDLAIAPVFDSSSLGMTFRGRL